jgi:ABC-type Mn2+/Zn2+ transport system permease subunit
MCMFILRAITVGQVTLASLVWPTRLFLCMLFREHHTHKTGLHPQLCWSLVLVPLMLLVLVVLVVLGVLIVLVQSVS